MKLFVLLILAVFASEKKEDTENDPKYGKRIEDNNEENSIVVKIEEDEYVKEKKKSIYIGVTYYKHRSKWCVQRWSKNENKNIYNGCNYTDEETAARASDTLARKLMENGEQNFKLNFSDDDTEVYRAKKSTSKYIGVTYYKNTSKWCARRWSRNENKNISNGYYSDEETAAHASDTLARKLIENGEQNLKLNFSDDDTEVYKKASTSKYIGVSYNDSSKWNAYRWSKIENKRVSNGCYDDEETAAHASDTLARKLIENGEQGHKLNFPDDDTEVHPKNQKKKRKRPQDLEHPQNN